MIYYENKGGIKFPPLYFVKKILQEIYVPAGKTKLWRL